MTKPWVDGPFKLISPPQGERVKGLSTGTIRVSSDMSLAHNMMIRGLNSIYLQAPNVTLPSDKKDFITYCQMWVEVLAEHHHLEETILFPRIEELTGVPGTLDVNVDQHHAFEKGVEEFKKYVYAVKVEEFEASKIKSLIDGFQGVLIEHLNDEINTLLALDPHGGEGGKLLEQAWNELDAKIISLVKDKSRVLPFGLGCNDATFEGGRYVFPKLPWFVPVMTSWIFWWKYRTVWRFSPCTVYGQPKELLFVKAV